MPENEVFDRYTLRNRYLFTGELVMQTALHIGGGKVTLSSSDSPVVLTAAGLPFIPGSSFKGALRSTVEKLVPMLPENAHLFTCGLIGLDGDALKAAKREQKENPSIKICPTAHQSDIVQQRRDDPDKAGEILENALKELCNTCQLFGSPYAASHVSVNDLYMPEHAWSDVIQIRDGVAIDRDSERARDGRKYDFEVVPASATFALEITLENATKKDLQLLCVGLSEYLHGFAGIGGRRSRGLGACKLEKLQVSALELALPDEKNPLPKSERDRRFRNYLLHREFSSVTPGEAFLNSYISSIFE
jgi:CRISPR-associated RAMP protein (TIGR02581 family)